MAARAPAARKACQSAPSRMPPQATMSSRSAAPGAAQGWQPVGGRCRGPVAAARRRSSQRWDRRHRCRCRPPRPPVPGVPRCWWRRWPAHRCRGRRTPAPGAARWKGRARPWPRAGTATVSRRAPQSRRARASVWRPCGSSSVLGQDRFSVYHDGRWGRPSKAASKAAAASRISRAAWSRSSTPGLTARLTPQAGGRSAAARPGRRQPLWRRDCAGRRGSASSASPCRARRHSPGCPGAASA